jgi:predicted ATPase
MPHFVALQANAYEIAGDVEQALNLMDDALQIVERTGERWFSAELNRRPFQTANHQNKPPRSEMK